MCLHGNRECDCCGYCKEFFTEEEEEPETSEDI